LNNVEEFEEMISNDSFINDNEEELNEQQNQ
jgi:hypothetical protein